MEKQQHPIDDFLKETLKGHQLVPREEARKAFLEEASAIRPARRSWLRWYYLPVLVVVLSGIVALFSYFGDENELPVVAIQGIIPYTDTVSSSSISNSSSNTAFIELNRNEKTNPESNPAPETKAYQSATPVAGVKSGSKAESAISIKATPEKVPVIAVVAEPANALAPVSEKPAFTDLPGSNISLAQDPATLQPVAIDVQAANDTNTTVSPAFEPKDDEPLQNLSENSFAASVFYLPEYMFNTVEGSKFVNNFGLDFTFYRGRTSIRTGAGISVSQGVTEKAVEYNEFLGTYNKLDSITFVYSESENNFYPNVFTSSENVWDSLSLFDSTEIVKRYTYLQIPLILGFDFWQKSRITVGVRIGTVMSVMLKSRQLTGEYNPGSNQVLGISQLSPDRVSMNWQAVGGINGSLMLTRRLYLEIEPQAKYYYQSIYEKSGYDKKPWSVGLRVAMQYKF